MTTIKIPAEIAENLVYKHLHKETWTEFRWSTSYRVVVVYDGKYYFMIYELGNTEYQEVDMFDGPEVELIECHEVERLMKVWEPISP